MDRKSRRINLNDLLSWGITRGFGSGFKINKNNFFDCQIMK